MKIFSGAKQAYYDVKQRNITVRNGCAVDKKSGEYYYGDIKKVNKNGDTLTLRYHDGDLREARVNGELKKIYTPSVQDIWGEKQRSVLEINSDDTFTITRIADDKRDKTIEVKKETYEMTPRCKALVKVKRLKNIGDFLEGNKPVSETVKYTRYGESDRYSIH